MRFGAGRLDGRKLVDTFRLSLFSKKSSRIFSCVWGKEGCRRRRLISPPFSPGPRGGVSGVNGCGGGSVGNGDETSAVV